MSTAAASDRSPQVAARPVDVGASPYARLQTLPLGGVWLSRGFWADRQALNRTVSIPEGYRLLDQAGNFHNLRLAGGVARGPYRGPNYMDSDLYKWLEAVAFALATPSEERAQLEQLAREAIQVIAGAQDASGYVDSYYQVVAPERRWTDLQSRGHELYLMGHLIQAAVAHWRSTGSDELLCVARGLADHVDATFGPRKRAVTSEHAEIEMALIELYRATREARYLALAAFIIDQRGRGALGQVVRGHDGNTYYAEGGASTGAGVVCVGTSALLPAHQDAVPVREAVEVEGHAVRALYLTSGVTDLYLETGERALLAALERQWQDMTARKMFVTGGVGSRFHSESFGEPYELPNDRCYCETCAAIASVMWNWRMLLATGEARFADLIERTLYNAVLCGISLDGRRYAYANPLISRAGIERQEWFTCACCPPNVMRLFASLNHYVATTDAGGVQIHQYASGEIQTDLAEAGAVALRVTTRYPWDGHVAIDIVRSPAAAWQLSLRVPSWCERPVLRLNGASRGLAASDGYAALRRHWKAGDRVELDLPMAPRLIEAHPRIDPTRASVAIERGPLVYCLEFCDQAEGVDVQDVVLDEHEALGEEWREDLLGGVVTVSARGQAVNTREWGDQLYRPRAGRNGPAGERVVLTAIPYFAWANRGRGAMRVWIPRAGAS